MLSFVTVLTGSISRFGWIVFTTVSSFGRFTDFAARTAMYIVCHPMSWLRWRQIGPQLYSVGVASIPVVAITGAFIGMILAIEGFAQFKAIGQEARMGGIINVSVTSQIGPVLAAVMVAGRVGGALAAETGTMRVTEQLDAMRVMGVDPIRHLVVPRVMACMIMTPILTIYSDILGSWGAWLVITKGYGVSSYDYWHFTAMFMGTWDPIAGLFKSLCFGASIGLISCYKGFYCAPGAAGVGRSATNAFVASFLAIIMLNLVLAKFLRSLWMMLNPDGIQSMLG
ncbi:MAG: ABC transporter permease [Phycisphaerae bacterium]|nr:ABC transporter permease [Phycisphaerae bacterium]